VREDFSWWSRIPRRWRRNYAGNGLYADCAMADAVGFKFAIACSESKSYNGIARLGRWAGPRT
jgi:hypothetical protein